MTIDLVYMKPDVQGGIDGRYCISVSDNMNQALKTIPSLDSICRMNPSVPSNRKKKLAIAQFIFTGSADCLLLQIADALKRYCILRCIKNAFTSKTEGGRDKAWINDDTGFGLVASNKFRKETEFACSCKGLQGLPSIISHGLE